MATIRPVERELSGGCRGLDGGPWQRTMMRNHGGEWDYREGLYGLYRAMEERDAHLFSTLQTRKNALLACPWKVTPGDGTPAAQEAARLVERNLRGLPGLSGTMFHLLDALGKGFAVAEILWHVDGATGEVTAKDVRPRSPWAFALDEDGVLHLLKGTANGGAPAGASAARELIPRPGEGMLWARHTRPMPARKFLQFAFQGSSCAPYGAALCGRAYRYYALKMATLDQWALFNEKFGSPTAVARYPDTIEEEELRRLEEVIARLPSDSGVVLPEGVALDFLEARRSSGMNTYRELADWCNDEISKIVLGQTLTTSEGRRTGSLALGQVHERVRQDYLASDAAALGQVISDQLARWITDFNFGPAVASPRIEFDTAPAEHFEAELRIDRELIRMGVPLPADYFYGRYRRPVPAPDERTLRYDDANLYQYHLLYGVLTVNEVRTTLGLPAVPWGDVPTARSNADAPAPGGPREGEPDEPASDAAESPALESVRDRRTH